MKAAELKEADLDYRIHMQAFLNYRQVLRKKSEKIKKNLYFQDLINSMTVRRR